ncbi:MAG: hypothetical protein AB1898_17365 [Acidobacteriota bacterium]
MYRSTLLSLAGPKQHSNRFAARPRKHAGQTLFLVFTFAACGAFGSWSGFVRTGFAESLTDRVRLNLRRADLVFKQFESSKQLLNEAKSRERSRVPDYNLELSNTVAEFQRHIADQHYRHTRCLVCTTHVKRIRELAKKIDDGMK